MTTTAQRIASLERQLEALKAYHDLESQVETLKAENRRQADQITRWWRQNSAIIAMEVEQRKRADTTEQEAMVLRRALERIAAACAASQDAAVAVACERMARAVLARYDRR